MYGYGSFYLWKMRVDIEDSVPAFDMCGYSTGKVNYKKNLSTPFVAYQQHSVSSN
jgi:hypothetical protein